jgi:TM2 domain-containing membrane protein YozV
MTEKNITNHPGMAAVLSFLFNGLGQLYNGEIAKGLAIVFFSGCSMILTVLGAVFIGSCLVYKSYDSKILPGGIILFFLGIILICIIGIYSILDAYAVAKKQ